MWVGVEAETVGWLPEGIDDLKVYDLKNYCNSYALRDGRARKLDTDSVAKFMTRDIFIYLYLFWYSRSCRFAISLKSQATHWESGKTLMQILQNAKAKFKVSGMKPRRTPAKKTVASVTFIENFLHRLWTRLGKDHPHLLKVVDVRTFLTLVNEYLKLILRPNH